MVSLEAFSELLQVLYSAPLQQEQWQRFLALVSEHTRSRNSYFLSADTSRGLAALAQGGKLNDPTVVCEYNKNFSRNDPFRTAVIRQARIGVFTEEELLPGDGLLRTEIYRDFLVHWAFRHVTIAVFSLSVRRLDVISIWRTPDEGPMESDSKRLLELLIPHVQTALEIRRVFGVTQQNLASAEAMANASPTATFVLTRSGRVLHWNAAAEGLILAGDGLALDNSRLTACEPKSTGALRKLFLDVASPSFSLSGSHPSRFISLRRASGNRPLQLTATPLPEGQKQRSGGDLLLLVTDPEKPSNFPDDALRALYDFTPTETEVANGLLMGYSPQEIACLRRVSVGTVRQQVKSMLGKTGTSRQSEMVRLIMTLPQPPMQAA